MKLAYDSARAASENNYSDPMIEFSDGSKVLLDQWVTKAIARLQSEYGGQVVAERLGISNQQLTNIKNGRRQFPLSSLPFLLALLPGAAADFRRSLDAWTDPIGELLPMLSPESRHEIQEALERQRLERSQRRFA